MEQNRINHNQQEALVKLENAQAKKEIQDQL
jgi:hypothetical protein